MGGGGFMLDARSPLDDFLLSLSPSSRPRICLVPTPSGDCDRLIAAFFEAFSALRASPAACASSARPRPRTSSLPSRTAARAYRVEPAAETPIETTLLRPAHGAVDLERSVRDRPRPSRGH